MMKCEARESLGNRRLGRWLRAAGVSLGVMSAAVFSTFGCLDRPVQPQEPRTSNIFVAEIRQSSVDKIDLLFMIDNSISMADKQEILAKAVPVLVRRLVTPACIDADERPTGENANAQGSCSRGTPEFSPIKDIHIGIVTSSLGAHAGDAACLDTLGDDKGELIGTPTRRPNRIPNTDFSTYADAAGVQTGFLAWDPDPLRARNDPRGETDTDSLNRNFTNMLKHAGENGCGYEASLEAWYRFLIDPEPPTFVKRSADQRFAEVEVPADRAQNPVLVQRDKFLRPDSLVAIIMLTDENDCSIMDAGQGFLTNSRDKLPRANSACLADPNSACCTSCGAGPNPNCPDHRPPGADPECSKGAFTGTEDNANLRCFNQKQRFGMDFLYPVERYIDGLTQHEIRNRAGALVANPLFTDKRDDTLIFLAGIVGVPWQDVATSESLQENANLQYLTYDEMEKEGRWNWILGSPGDSTTPPGKPLDGLMFETIRDRTTLADLPQTHPATKQPIASAQMTGRPNTINGHETNIPGGNDLQYACIFPLAESRSCTGAGCDCLANDPNSLADDEVTKMNRAVCDGPSNPGVQSYAKAYPGVRHLQVLQGLGKKTHNAIVASICPKKVQSSDPNGDPGYGYNPAVAAIVDRLKEALRGKCLPRKLVPDPDNFKKVPCSVVEAQIPKPGAACGPCDANPGRVEVNPDIIASAQRTLEENDRCGPASADKLDCKTFCLCEIQQLLEDDMKECQTASAPPTNIYGYCYVDPEVAKAAGDEVSEKAQREVVAKCPNTQKRLLRFAGDNVPAKGAYALIACLGATGESAAGKP